VNGPGSFIGRVTAWWNRIRSLIEIGRLLFLRDYRARVRQTFLGSAWLVGQVLLSFLPLVLVGGQLGLGAGKGPRLYALHSIFGLLLWQMFWDGLYSPQWVARRLRGLLSEVPFPHEAVLVAGCNYALFNASIYVLIMVAAYASIGIVPPASAVLGLLAAPFIIMAGVAVGVFFVPVSFVYLDIRYGLPLIAPMLMWTAPILYDSPASGPLHWLNQINPLTYLIMAPRQWLTTGWQLDELGFPVAILVAGALLLVGLRFYRYSMPRALECLPRR